MKVIHEPDKWHQQIRCGHCKKKLEIYEEDLKVFNDAPIGSSPQIKIQCCNCLSDNTITSSVPYELQEKLFKKRKKHLNQK